MLYSEEIEYREVVSRKRIKAMYKSVTGATKLCLNPHLLGASMRAFDLGFFGETSP